MSKPFVNTSIVIETAGWDMGFHRHPNSLEISAVLQGKGQFECLGVVHSIEAGHVVVIPPDLPHAYRAETAMQFGVLEIGFPSPETMRLFAELAPEPRPSLLSLSPMALEQYQDLFRQWLRILSGSGTDRFGLIKAWSEVIILYMLQYRSDKGASLSLARSADFIREQLKSELSIPELARACGLSESAYRVAFKHNFGISPKQYQQQCRAEESKFLLRTTDLQVQSVAEQVGFATIHAFSAWFQKREGLSPSEWRRRQQQHSIEFSK